MNRRRWALYGVLYFTAVFALVPGMASAYIDPSVTTYAIQAIAGVAVAAGAFFATYGRRMKKSWMRTLDMDENESRIREAPLEVSREDLQEKLREKRAARAAQPAAAGKKKRNLRGRIITSLLCGFAPALALILRPIITFYLANEGEFWFELGDVMPDVLLVFFGMALGTALVHFLLPDGKRFSPRLLLAVLVAAGTLCVFIQDHFMSGYLPTLTGEAIDWSLYKAWNLYSLALWGGVFLLFLAVFAIRPRTARAAVYGLMILLLCAEAVNGTIDLATAKNENRRSGTYFTQNGMYETSKAGNVVVLVSDTFEGTYMNQILEDYPEVRELLDDCTYYDNVTGVSVFTYFSYAKLMSGVDFPIGKASEEGVTYCLENQTTMDRIHDNGWEIGYYTDFSPTPNIRDLLINYADQRLRPNRTAQWSLTKLLLRSTLFRSVPHPLKPKFGAYTLEFEHVKFQLEDASPFIENDPIYYDHLREKGLTAVDSAPRYTLQMLFGVHDPCTLDADFQLLTDRDELTVEERKIQTGRAQLKLLRLYLDQLKEAGTYDQTTVIMTADHGFNQRFYPVFLVKEANRSEEGFRVDHTPISMQADYADLMDALTAGKSFTEAIAPYAAEPERVRYALDFRSPVYETETTRRSIVEIRGEAKDPDSYTIARDEFLLDDHFTGRCEPGTPFVSRGDLNGTAAVYGLDESGAYGHSAVFDAFFGTEESRPMEFRAIVANSTGSPQRIEVSLEGGEVLETIRLEPEEGPVEFSVALPEETVSRRTIRLDFPDAELQEIQGEKLTWNTYASVYVHTAGLYE